MDISTVKTVFSAISVKMDLNEMYLIELDQLNGDGDLGIYMKQGFAAVLSALKNNTETDLGRAFLLISKTMNETAPSSLGTILSVAFMGMAKKLKGLKECTVDEIISAMETGLSCVCEKAGSKPGERTILDAFYPAVEAMKLNCHESAKTMLTLAAQAARAGAEETKNMRPVHGRAAYYGEKSIGHLDGGAVAGALIFEAIAEI